MHLSVVCLSVSTNVILCVYLGDDMDRWVAWLICGWLVDLLVYCLGHWPTNQLLHGLTLQIWRGSFLLKLVQNKEQYIYRYLPIEFHVYTPLYPMFHVFVFVCVCQAFGRQCEMSDIYTYSHSKSTLKPSQVLLHWPRLIVALPSTGWEAYQSSSVRNHCLGDRLDDGTNHQEEAVQTWNSR